MLQTGELEEAGGVVMSRGLRHKQVAGVHSHLRPNQSQEEEGFSLGDLRQEQGLLSSHSHRP